MNDEIYFEEMCRPLEWIDHTFKWINHTFGRPLPNFLVTLLDTAQLFLSSAQVEAEKMSSI